MKETIQKFIKRYHRWLQLGLTILFFYVLFKRFPFASCLDLFNTIHISLLMLGILFLALGQVCYGLAWQAILKILGHHIPTSKTINIFFQSIFVNNFATFVGGDVFRGIKIYGDAENKFNVGFSLLLSRFLMLFSIVWIAGGAVFLWGKFLVPGAWFPILGLTVFLFFTTFFIGFKRFSFRRKRNFKSWLEQFFQKFSERSAVVQDNYLALIFVFFWNVAGHFCGFLVIWIFGKSLTIPLALWQVILFLSIVRLIIILPVTVNGLGMREVGFVGLLTRLGFQQIEGFSLGLLASAATLFVSFFGGLLLLFDALQIKNKG